MIIQIRGTSGSGKTTVMRAVMDRLGRWEPRYQKGRRKPICYARPKIDSLGRIAVLGHYESPCGGCDNVGSARAVYELIQEIGWEFDHVICEGLLLSEDVKWSRQLDDLRVVFLTTQLGDCLTRVRVRRESVGNNKPLDPRNTSNRVDTIERARKRLIDSGVYCRRVSDKQAHELILKWIGE